MDEFVLPECDIVSPLTFTPDVNGPVAIANMAVPGQYLIVYQQSSVTPSTTVKTETTDTELELPTTTSSEFILSTTTNNLEIPSSADYTHNLLLPSQESATTNLKLELSTTVLSDDQNFATTTNYNQGWPIPSLSTELELPTTMSSDFDLHTTATNNQDTPSSADCTDNLLLPSQESSTSTTNLKLELPTTETYFSDIQDFVTPTMTRTQSLTEASSSDCDTIGDYRFGESLFSLLSSPQPDSSLFTNPFFDDLKMTLTEECKKYALPSTLFSSFCPQRSDIHTREQELYTRFDKLKHAYPDAIHQLSGFYRYQTALVETERYRTLHEGTYSKTYLNSLKSHFDDEIHVIIDRVEKSVSLLEGTDRENKNCVNKSRPLLSRNAIKFMLDWYNAHLDYPYPTTETTAQIARMANISVEQVKKWFANKRNRSCNTKKLSDIANRKRKLSLVD